MAFFQGGFSLLSLCSSILVQYDFFVFLNFFNGSNDLYVRLLLLLEVNQFYYFFIIMDIFGVIGDYMYMIFFDGNGLFSGVIEVVLLFM